MKDRFIVGRRKERGKVKGRKRIINEEKDDQRRQRGEKFIGKRKKETPKIKKKRHDVMARVRENKEKI